MLVVENFLCSVSDNQITPPCCFTFKEKLIFLFLFQRSKGGGLDSGGLWSSGSPPVLAAFLSSEPYAIRENSELKTERFHASRPHDGNPTEIIQFGYELANNVVRGTFEHALIYHNLFNQQKSLKRYFHIFRICSESKVIIRNLRAIFHS